ncbi:MAG: carbohydrate ABC transporter permease [Christensenellales bacterium]|nr:carbohydrate ABC transporter permease [Christensenellales bacterium]
MRKKKWGWKLVRFSLIALYLMFIILPLLWMVGMSLKSYAEQYTQDITLFPIDPSWSNYVRIWDAIPLARYLKNSLVISICTMVVCLAVSIFAAYAMSKFRFRGRTFFSTAALFTQLMPGILFILPIYTVFVRIQQTTGIRLVGSYLGIVITYSTFGIPFSIWMMRSYFDTIPSDLAQAAMIDGCTRMQAFFRIILPLSLPGLAATGMYVFTLSWNEVLFATVLTNSETRTFSIGLREFEGQNTTDLGLIMAASVVVTVPVVALFMSFQRFIVSGLTGGGVKE